MIYRKAFLCLLGLASACSAFGQSSNPLQVERYQDEFDNIVSTSATFENIMSGFDWCEGPLWIKKGKYLLVSDVPQNTVYKWSAKKGKEIYLKPSGYTQNIPRGGEIGSNGLALTNNGQLILCQDGDRRVSIMDAPLKKPRADFEILAGAYQGKKFNSPNDIAVANNGDLYFTDPPYGLEKNMADPLKEIPYQGVYKIAPDKSVTLLIDSIDRPNGIALSPDGKSLLIANSFKAKAFIYKYDVLTDGTLANGRIFFDARELMNKERGAPDGLKIDSQGYVYATGPGGVYVFNPGGNLMGKIKISPVASNCALSHNEKVLFVTADDHVVKINLR